MNKRTRLTVSRLRTLQRSSKAQAIAPDKLENEQLLVQAYRPLISRQTGGILKRQRVFPKDEKHF